MPKKEKKNKQQQRNDSLLEGEGDEVLPLPREEGMGEVRKKHWELDYSSSSSCNDQQKRKQSVKKSTKSSSRARRAAEGQVVEIATSVSRAPSATGVPRLSFLTAASRDGSNMNMNLSSVGSLLALCSLIFLYVTLTGGGGFDSTSLDPSSTRTTIMDDDGGARDSSATLVTVKRKKPVAEESPATSPKMDFHYPPSSKVKGALPEQTVTLQAEAGRPASTQHTPEQADENTGQQHGGWSQSVLDLAKLIHRLPSQGEERTDVNPSDCNRTLLGPVVSKVRDLGGAESDKSSTEKKRFLGPTVPKDDPRIPLASMLGLEAYVDRVSEYWDGLDNLRGEGKSRGTPAERQERNEEKNAATQERRRSGRILPFFPFWLSKQDKTNEEEDLNLESTEAAERLEKFFNYQDSNVEEDHSSTTQKRKKQLFYHQESSQDHLALFGQKVLKELPWLHNPVAKDIYSRQQQQQRQKASHTSTTSTTSTLSQKIGIPQGEADAKLVAKVIQYLPEEERDGRQLPLTHYFQQRIAMIQKYGRADLHSTPSSEDNARSAALPEGILVVRVPKDMATSAGLGGHIGNIMTLQLSHALTLNRSLVIAPEFQRWTGSEQENSECASRGWECFFLPPGPISLNSSDSIEGKFKHGHGETGKRKRDVIYLRGQDSIIDVSRNNPTAVLVRNSFASRDLFTQRPFYHLVPPGVTEEDILTLTGLEYDDFFLSQCNRYLLRGVQPWLERLLLAEMKEKAGFPIFPPLHRREDEVGRSGVAEVKEEEESFLIASHIRNGEIAKDVESAGALRCFKLDSSLPLYFAEALYRKAKDVLLRFKSKHSKGRGRNIVLFFSFDDPALIEHDLPEFYDGARCPKFFKQTPQRNDMGTDVESNTPLLQLPPKSIWLKANYPSYSVSQFNRSDTSSDAVLSKDSREQVIKQLGRGHLTKMSLVNLFLATTADAWSNNDASSWSLLINQLRNTLGNGAHRRPYICMTGAAQSPLLASSSSLFKASKILLSQGRSEGTIKDTTSGVESGGDHLAMGPVQNFCRVQKRPKISHYFKSFQRKSDFRERLGLNRI